MCFLNRRMKANFFRKALHLISELFFANVESSRKHFSISFAHTSQSHTEACMHNISLGFVSHPPPFKKEIYFFCLRKTHSSVSSFCFVSWEKLYLSLHLLQMCVRLSACEKVCVRECVLEHPAVKFG